jgi:hypothetical protein
MALPTANPWGQFGGTSGAFTSSSGMTQASGSSGGDSGGSSFGTAGVLLQALGAVNSAIGSYYATKTAQYQADSQALTLEYQQSIANINARVAEQNAQQALLAGERQIGAVTMEYGQKKGTARASMAARGVTLGVGSAQEIIASTDLMKEVDALTINANAVRAAEAARMQKVSYQNESLLAGTNADIASSAASAMMPWASFGSSLVSGSAKVADSWYLRNKSTSSSASSVNTSIPSVST